MNTNTPGEITLTREFDAPRSRVFQAWTDPLQLAQWWGPFGFSNPRCELDPRPGGKIHVDMRGPDGMVYPMPGEYREIVEPERIVFTAGAADDAGTLLFEILNIVTFEEASEGKTRLTLRTELIHATEEAKERYLSGQKIGWSQSLVRFGEFLTPAEEQPGAPNEIIISRVFDAPRETVWEAITDPEQVVQWWGPHGFSTTIQEMDLRPGGVWNHVMHGPDGANYPNRSVFTEVVKPERLSYSHGGHKEGG
ncbi:MAG TPA: SRPBCC family protein, partial [Chthoniobacteraceae bacterium]|nr:SRPBCC family protein [Chthoniobacteraceae bacterium]